MRNTMGKEDCGKEKGDVFVVTALSSRYDRRYSICMVVGLLINVAMILYSHFGVSAVVVSSECPEGLSGCPERVDVSNLEGSCVNSDDISVFTPGSQAFESTASYMVPIGINCVAQQQCIVEEVIDFLGVSTDCALCFSESVNCPALNCFDFCAPPKQSTPECFQCFDDNCQESFRFCTGLNFPDRVTTSRALQVDDEECLDKSEFELFKVFNLTFINSIEKSFEGGSIALALFVLVSSGVWPYVKNLLMFIAWFIPLPTKRRGKILTILTLLGRWSLVDVFAVIVIINGVIIQKILGLNTELIVFAESRPGIYMFGIAALWALVQSELIKEFAEKSYPLRKEKIPLSPTVKDLREISRLKGFTILASLATVVFIAMSAYSTVLSMELSGRITTFNGPNELAYNLVEFGTALFSECALYDGHGSPVGAFFLGFLFLFLVVVLPLVHSLLIFVFGLKFGFDLVASKKLKWLFMIGSFASLDVFFITMLTVAGQIEGLIKATVGDGVDTQCGVSPELKAEGVFCISLSGKLEVGGILLGISVILHWFTQLIVVQLTTKAKKFI